MLGARASAWKLGVTWGDERTQTGEAIGWGVACRDGAADCDQGPWTAPCSVVTPDCDPAAAIHMMAVPGMLEIPVLEDTAGTEADEIAAESRGTAARPRDDTAAASGILTLGSSA